MPTTSIELFPSWWKNTSLFFLFLFSLLSFNDERRRRKEIWLNWINKWQRKKVANFKISSMRLKIFQFASRRSSLLFHQINKKMKIDLLMWQMFLSFTEEHGKTNTSRFPLSVTPISSSSSRRRTRQAAQLLLFSLSWWHLFFTCSDLRSIRYQTMRGHKHLHSFVSPPIFSS